MKFRLIIIITALVIGIRIANADEIDDLIKDCPYMCIPEQAYDDMNIDANTVNYSDMALSCSAGIQWGEVKNFMSKYFSVETNWGRGDVQDRLLRDAYVWGLIEEPDPIAIRYHGLYSRMYYKVKKETASETAKIVADQNGMNETDINQIMSGNIVPLVRSGMKIEDAYKEAERIRTQYKTEASLVNLASDLKGETEPTELFTNGTIEDSGYDLIVDLNIIDKILFKNDEPEDTGDIYHKEKGKKLSTKITDMKKEREMEEKCKAIEEGKVEVQSKVTSYELRVTSENQIQNSKIKNQNEYIENSKLKTQNSKPQLKAQNLNNTDSNQMDGDIIQESDTIVLKIQSEEEHESMDPAACTSGSQAVDHAVENFFELNQENEEIAELKEDLEAEEVELEQVKQKKEKGQPSEEEEEEEEPVTVNGEEITKEEYEELKEECERRKEEENKPKEEEKSFLADLKEKADKKYAEYGAGCVSGEESGEEESNAESNNGNNDELPSAGELKAKICFKLDFEMGPVTAYRKTDNCIACHLDHIIKDLDSASNVNFMSDKVTGNLFEPNICKFSQPAPIININLITKPIVTPTPTNIADDNKFGVVWQEYWKTVKWSELRLSSNYWKQIDWKTLSTTDSYVNYDNAEDTGFEDADIHKKASELVFSKKPADMTIDEATKRISDIVAQEVTAQEERRREFVKRQDGANRSAFGRLLQVELNDMLASFESISEVLTKMTDVNNPEGSCKELKDKEGNS